jgi:hypothetical protein
MTEILRFLEAYSRTGLPGTVRSQVETAGRQHGRIRLVPVGYALVTEDERLLKELRSLKMVAPLLGEELTERVTGVAPDRVAELMRALRARGYAPLNLAEIGEGPRLPEDPSEAVPDITVNPHAIRTAAGDGDWGFGEEEAVEISTERVSDPGEIRRVLSSGEDSAREVQIGYQDGRGVEARTIWPLAAERHAVYAFCCETQRERSFPTSQIAWARFTGESFAGEYV